VVVPVFGSAKRPPRYSLEFKLKAVGLTQVPGMEANARTAHGDQPRVSASSFSTVFQLRAVPEPPRCLSIRFGVSFERPTPSG
jgi:hypothetical protein